MMLRHPSSELQKYRLNSDEILNIIFVITWPRWRVQSKKWDNFLVKSLPLGFIVIIGAGDVQLRWTRHVGVAQGHVHIRVVEEVAVFLEDEGVGLVADVLEVEVDWEEGVV